MISLGRNICPNPPSNFPNPFNPSTTIAFSLPNDSFVSSSIFNIRGQLVATISNRHFESGHHSVIWNGTDDHGRQLGSGIYFYQLKADNIKATRRMILLK